MTSPSYIEAVEKMIDQHKKLPIRIIELEAKLAKALDLAVYAVNALDEIQTYEQPDDPWTENALTMGELDAFDFNVEIARATLKDLGVDMV